MKRGFRSFAIPQKGFAVMPLLNWVLLLQCPLADLFQNLITFLFPLNLHSCFTLYPFVSFFLPHSRTNQRRRHGKAARPPPAQLQAATAPTPTLAHCRDRHYASPVRPQQPASPHALIPASPREPPLEPAHRTGNGEFGHINAAYSSPNPTGSCRSPAPWTSTRRRRAAAEGKTSPGYCRAAVARLASCCRPRRCAGIDRVRWHRPGCRGS